MEQLTSGNKESTALKQLSQHKLSETIAANNFKAASEMLPKTIEQTFEQPKVKEMVLAIGEIPVKRMVQFELIKLAELMSVGGNLNTAQVDFISEELMKMYPNETIADFKICFRNGAIGKYGDIQRMDGITIGKWMAEYLEEKYKILEEQLMKEKDDYYKIVTPENSERDWLKEWQDAVNNSDGFKPVRPMSQEEIKAEGQVDAKDKVYVFNESEAQIKLRETHDRLWTFQEMTVRERHPEWTEEQIQERLKELKETVLYEETRLKHLPEVAKIWEKKKRKRTA